MLRSLSPEVLYILVVVGLFLVPRVLQRFHLPSAITSVGLGAALGMGLHAFEGDTTVPLLATLGIVSLFLFAGLEVDFEELRRGRRSSSSISASRPSCSSAERWSSASSSGSRAARRCSCPWRSSRRPRVSSSTRSRVSG